MQVETYECTETTLDGQTDLGPEAVALIEELGLEGQSSLVSGTKTSVCPYREMTVQERRVYLAICPTRNEVARYKCSPIPLRVLQVIAHAKTLDTFQAIEVWHAGEQYDKDPVLVGIGNGGYYYGAQSDLGGAPCFILARWGEELAPFSELVARAGATLKANILASCAKIVARCRALAEEVAAMTPQDVTTSNMVPPKLDLAE